jgi:hypothetical protein
MGGGLAAGDRTITAPGAALEFTAIAVAENTSMAPLADSRTDARPRPPRQQLARKPGEVVIVDGPLQPLRRPPR